MTPPYPARDAAAESWWRQIAASAPDAREPYTSYLSDGAILHGHQRALTTVLRELDPAIPTAAVEAVTGRRDTAARRRGARVRAALALNAGDGGADPRLRPTVARAAVGYVFEMLVPGSVCTNTGVGQWLPRIDFPLPRWEYTGQVHHGNFRARTVGGANPVHLAVRGTLGTWEIVVERGGSSVDPRRGSGAERMFDHLTRQIAEGVFG